MRHRRTFYNSPLVVGHPLKTERHRPALASGEPSRLVRCTAGIGTYASATLASTATSTIEAMAESFSDFLAEHKAEHRSSFNRSCLIVGDVLQVAGMLTAARGRWKRGAMTMAVGFGVVISGHIRDGNVPKSLETSRAHPLWNVRGDVAIARETLLGRS
jgi:hypothetical protein